MTSLLCVKNIYVFAFYIISSHLSGTCSWKHHPWKTQAHLSYIFDNECHGCWWPDNTSRQKHQQPWFWYIHSSASEGLRKTRPPVSPLSLSPFLSLYLSFSHIHTSTHRHTDTYTTRTRTHHTVRNDRKLFCTMFYSCQDSFCLSFGFLNENRWNFWPSLCNVPNNSHNSQCFAYCNIGVRWATFMWFEQHIIDT